MNALIAAGAAVGCIGAASVAATVGTPKAAAPNTDVAAEQTPDNATVLANVLKDASTGVFGEDIIALEDRELGVCMIFAPGTSPEYMEKRMSLLREQSLRFEPNDRWGGIGSGNGPVNLTYSFPPDTANGGPSSLGNFPQGENFNDMNSAWNAAFSSVGGEPFWKDKFRQSFDDWEQVTGNNYTEVTDGNPSRSWPSVDGPFNNGVNGDIRIVSSLDDGPGGVLAFNFFPDTGDMHLDSADLNSYTNSNNNYRFLRNVVIHENGHGMGLSHSCPVQGTKLMEPFINTSFDGSQLDDVLGMQVLYGDKFEPNNSTAAATPPTESGILPDVTKVNAALSISPDADYYRLTISGESTIEVSVTPQLGTYPAGPQNGDGSCSQGTEVDVSDNANLRIEILDSNGQQIGLRDQNPAGQGETLPTFNLPSAGDFFIRITASNFDDIQLYTMSTTITGGGCPGDLNGDGDVDGGDLGTLLGVWGDASGFPSADLNGDGSIDGADLGLLLSCWTG